MEPSAEDIAKALYEMLNSKQFREKKVLAPLLFYLVGHAAAKADDQFFKETVLGVEIWGSPRIGIRRRTRKSEHTWSGCERP